MQSYIHGTQRGYSVGLTDGRKRYAEQTIRIRPVLKNYAEEVDRAYRHAQVAARGLELTYKRARHLLDMTPLPGGVTESD